MFQAKPHRLLTWVFTGICEIQLIHLNSDLKANIDSE